MGTRRSDILIRRVRNETFNQDYGPNAGISDSQILEYLNDGIRFIEEGITSEHANVFSKEALLDIIAGQEKYDLPDDMLMGGGVISVEYALNDPNSTNPCWQPVRKVNTLERAQGFRSQVPEYYNIMGKQLWLSPVTQTTKLGCLRIVYCERLDRIDIRRGTVIAASLDSGTKTITNLQINNYGTPDEFNLNEVCCVVDSDGNQKMKGIKLDGELALGVVPVRSDFIYKTGETIDVGDYIVFGSSSSTHELLLDEAAERFLTAYAAWKVLRDDSNSDSNDQLTELKELRDSILEAYSRPNEDITLVPELG